MNFEAHYGSMGKDFIHAHHIRPLAEKEGFENVDPRLELKSVLNAQKKVVGL